MRIDELNRSDLRTLSKGPEIDSRGEDDSPERDDIRKRSISFDKKGKGKRLREDKK